MATLLSTRALQDDLAFVDEQLRRHSDPFDTVRNRRQSARVKAFIDYMTEALVQAPELAPPQADGAERIK